MNDLIDKIKTLNVVPGTVIVFKGNDLDIESLNNVSRLLNGHYTFKVPIIMIQDGEVDVMVIDQAIAMLQEMKEEMNEQN